HKVRVNAVRKVLYIPYYLLTDRVGTAGELTLKLGANTSFHLLRSLFCVNIRDVLNGFLLLRQVVLRSQTRGNRSLTSLLGLNLLDNVLRHETLDDFAHLIRLLSDLEEPVLVPSRLGDVSSGLVLHKALAVGVIHTDTICRSKKVLKDVKGFLEEGSIRLRVVLVAVRAIAKLLLKLLETTLLSRRIIVQELSTREVEVDVLGLRVSVEVFEGDGELDHLFLLSFRG